jgi:hypothetical protein
MARKTDFARAIDLYVCPVGNVDHPYGGPEAFDCTEEDHDETVQTVRREYIPIEDGRKLLIRLDDQQRVNAETIGKVERQRNKLRSRLIELGDDPDKLLADGGAD